jgi:hypothetical protein
LAAGCFPGSRLVALGDLEFEVVEGGVYRSVGLLDGLREEVLRVAARSRGWDAPGDLDFFRRSFKLGPLYEAQALALVRRQGCLVGLAGSVNDWPVEEGSIVHLCSLGLLPEIQARGILPVLMSLLWTVTLRNPAVARDHQSGRLFTTAITQSPFILWFMARVADLFPSPEREATEPDRVRVARQVVARFDPHLPLDERTFVLRGECEFRYRRIPYSRDRRLNRFCDRRLRYDDGDVFVVVGQVVPRRLERFLRQVRQAYPDLGAALDGQVQGAVAC